MVDASVDAIARKLVDKWTRTPIIEFAETLEDAVFLEAAAAGPGWNADQIDELADEVIRSDKRMKAAYEDTLHNFLSHLDSPDFTTVWHQYTDVRGGGDAKKSTRNAVTSQTVNAAFFLRAFLKKKGPSKPDSKAPSRQSKVARPTPAAGPSGPGPASTLAPAPASTYYDLDAIDSLAAGAAGNGVPVVAASGGGQADKFVRSAKALSIAEAAVVPPTFTAPRTAPAASAAPVPVPAPVVSAGGGGGGSGAGGGSWAGGSMPPPPSSAPVPAVAPADANAAVAKTRWEVEKERLQREEEEDDDLSIFNVAGELSIGFEGDEDLDLFDVSLVDDM